MCFPVNFTKFSLFREQLWMTASVITTLKFGILATKNTSMKSFSLFKHAHYTCARKRKRKRNLIVKKKETFFYTNFSCIATLKNKDNAFFINFFFLNLYVFWLTAFLISFICEYMSRSGTDKSETLGK